jgi:hypothetical protein
MGELQPGSRRWEEREWLRNQEPGWWEDVFDRIACGESPSEVVRGYCIRFAMFGRVLEEDLARKMEYEAALKIAADGYAFETLPILDAATPEDIAVAKARSDGRWKLASKMNRDRWGERVQVEKVVKVEVDAGLVGLAGALLDRLSAPRERVIATIAHAELEADAGEAVPAETPTGPLHLSNPPRQTVSVDI